MKVDIILKHPLCDANTVYENKGRSGFDLSEDRQYWKINMKFILQNLSEQRQSTVKDEQFRCILRNY